MGARVIRPGIAAVAQPMPGHPLGSSNCYLIATDGGAIVVDPGYERPGTLRRIASGLASIDRRLADVRTVVLTHHHRDHAEAAHAVRVHTGAAVAVHPADEGMPAVGVWGATPGSPVPASWGVPAPLRTRMLARPPALVVHADLDLAHGTALATTQGAMRVVHTPGHTGGSICLVIDDARVVLMGDHVLPDIHPGAGLGGRFAANPLLAYRESLRAMGEYAGFVGLPGHGAPLHAVPRRAGQIARHHERRTREVADVIAGHPDATVWELARRVGWSGGFEALDDGRMLSALRQTFWHAQLAPRDGS